MLPYEGEVIYLGSVFNRKEITSYYQNLLQEIPWQNDEAIIFGKHHITKRKVAWFGDKAYNYSYSGVTKQAHLWTPELLQLKKKVE